MALQFIDSFDHYYLTNDIGFQGGQNCMAQKYDSSVDAGSIFPDLTAGRFGGAALNMQSSAGQAWINKSVTTVARDEMVVGFAFLPKASRSDTTRIHFRLDDTTNVKMTIDMAPKTVTVQVQDVTTVASSAAVMSAGAWQYMEFKVKIHSTLGTVEVRRDGVTIASATNINTGTTGVLINTLRLEANNNAQHDFIDDLYWLDTTGGVNDDFLGDSRVDVLHPEADGATNDFTLTDDGEATDSPHLENWQSVRNSLNIVIGRDHNYVESGLVGAREDYDNVSLASVGVTPLSIYGVQVVNNTKRTATGALHFKDEMTIAGVQYDKGTAVVSTTGDYTMSTFIRDTDPSDGLAWTEGKVNAVGSGFTITFKET